jgi:FkbM family methyltransferase
MKFVRQSDLPYPQPWEFVIYNLLGNMQNGIFVDVGAYDGNIVSNTFHLEDHLNWTGICIEPNPTAFEKLNKTRNCTCLNIGVSDIETEMDFYKVNGYAEMLSGFLEYLSEDHKIRINQEITKHNDSVEIHKIKTRRLDNILKEHNISNVDYLSIDTEGNELRVVNSINFEECFIKIISAENSDGDNELKNFLQTKNFRFIGKVCGDEIFLNERLLQK